MKFIKNLTTLFALIAMMTFFNGCKKEKGCTDVNASNYNPNARQNDGSCKYTGTATFYSYLYGPSPTVTISGQTGTTTQYFNSPISDCGVNGCATFTLPAGDYTYTASSTLYNWGGSITVSPNACSIIQLANANTTFYSPTYVGTTISINGQTAKITQAYASISGCNVAGCANFYLAPGNYPYSATDSNGHQLTLSNPSISITVDSICNTVLLQ